MTQKTKNIDWIIAGFLCLFTALVHLIGGQFSLVNPLMESGLTSQVKTEWLGVWHGVTGALFLSAIYLLKYGFNASKNTEASAIQLIGIFYLLFSMAFVVSSLWMQDFAPQWILLLPIGILSLKKKKYEN